MSTARVARSKRGIARRIKEIRGERSQRAFARDLGVSQQNISHYERGTTPHPNFLMTVALAEDVSLDWLLLGEGTMRKRGRVRRG